MTGGESNVRRGEDPVEFGWNVHSAQNAWTAKVDTKASIVLSLEAVAFGFVVSLTGPGKTFDHLAGNRLGSFRIGLGLLFVSLVLAAASVIPMMSRWKSRKKNKAKHGLIYFGHLRHQTPEDLAKQLREMTTGSDIDQLARQLVEMSKINWRKHSCLQASMLTLFVAATALVWAGR